MSFSLSRNELEAARYRAVPASELGPPAITHHRFILVERAEQLLQGGDFSLAEVVAHAGFSDQSQFCHHFKGRVGVTPGQFRMPARTDKQGASPCKTL
jgi:transcriptional regulator GlxA family with amidase domain